MWHFCSKSDSDKLEKLNKRAFRSFVQDKDKDYQSLSTMANKNTLYNRLQNIVLIIQ